MIDESQTSSSDVITQHFPKVVDHRLTSAVESSRSRPSAAAGTNNGTRSLGLRRAEFGVGGTPSRGASAPILSLAKTDRVENETAARRIDKERTLMVMVMAEEQWQ